MKTILLFSGSNSPDSINQKIVEYAQSQLSRVDGRMIDLKEYELPIFSTRIEEEEGIPEPAQKLHALIRSADGLLISVPEHNGSVPAFFKNTIDWLSRVKSDYRVFKEKPVLFFSTSPGRGGGKNSIGHAQSILKRLGAEIIDAYPIQKFYDTVNTRGNEIRIEDQEVQQEICKSLEKLETRLAGQK